MGQMIIMPFIPLKSTLRVMWSLSRGILNRQKSGMKDWKHFEIARSESESRFAEVKK